MNMPTTAKKAYTVTPVNGEAPYEVNATKYEFSDTTGRHLFYDGDDLVANLLNVSVRQS
jgi:hypothetical protein